MDIDLDGIKTAFDLIRQSIGLVKDTNELTQDDEKKAVVVQSLESASTAASTAEAQIAQSLGYNLCQCTFPPQIMLSQGRYPGRVEEFFKCPKCAKQEPSEHYFHEMAMVDAHNRGDGDEGV